MAKSTRAQYTMFGLWTLEGSGNVISLQDWVDGATLSTSQVGPTTGKSGPDPALANRSPSRARAMAATIPVTYGQHGSISSASVALQQSLESRLRRRFDTAGGTWWPMTWKKRATPALRSVSLLSPLVRRTSDNGCGSLPMPTPTAGDGKSSGSRMTPGSKAHPGTLLTDFVRQDGAMGRVWRSPMASDARGSSGKMKPGKQMQLVDQALFPTPAAQSYGTSNNGCPGDGREEYRTKGKPSLETMARHGLWPTPTQSLGEHAGLVTEDKGREGGTLVEAVSAREMWPTPAERDHRHPNAVPHAARRGKAAKKGEQLPNAVGGVLNPAWVSALMGLPPAWIECAPGKAIGKKASRAPSPSTPAGSDGSKR